MPDSQEIEGAGTEERHTLAGIEAGQIDTPTSLPIVKMPVPLSLADIKNACVGDNLLLLPQGAMWA